MTEIAPGMMVECIWSDKGNLGRKAIVSKILNAPHDSNQVCKSPRKCHALVLIGWLHESKYSGFASCCFKPIGGDKEIEQQESKRTGKSAKDNIKNKELTNNYKFFIIDMDDK